MHQSRLVLQKKGFDKVFGFDVTINKDDKKPTFKKYNKSNLINDRSNHQI